MYFGADYHPEHWVYPYDGTPENPEAAWAEDIQKMANAGINVVRMGEFSWGLCEKEEGRYDFDWLKRVMDLLAQHEISIVLSTPTAAPPQWLSRKHPEILPIDSRGLKRYGGTRRACCMNSDVYWEYSRRIVDAMARALGQHPGLIAWQIDNGIGRHNTEYSFNEETRRDWHAWLKAKYEDIENLNNLLGLRFWGQVVQDWDDIPMPMDAPAVHNPALITDWRRFASDTCVSFVRMQKDILKQHSPNLPVTTSLRAFACELDYFDMADELDFVAVDGDAAVKERSAEIACGIDFMRSIKKTDWNAPDGEEGFWVIEQKAGSVSWERTTALVRPDVLRLFTYQMVSRGANGVLYFYWRQPRIGPEKFYGGALSHGGSTSNRTYEEIARIGKEIQILGPQLKGTKVPAEVAIITTHDNFWAQNQPLRQNHDLSQREHIQLFYAALHDRNIPCDFARPTDDLEKYKLVIVPSLHMLAAGEADRLRLYAYNGGTIIGTCNTGLVDEHHMAPSDGFPFEMQDLFGLRVIEFDALPSGAENHINFRGTFPTTHMHPARLWCDRIVPNTCEVLGSYAKDFYAGEPSMTINEFGNGKAIYIGFLSHQDFYLDLITWVRGIANVFPLMKVPESVEVSMREGPDCRIYFLLNHHPNSVRMNFLKPLQNALTDERVSGAVDIPSHGVLVLRENIRNY